MGKIEGLYNMWVGQIFQSPFQTHAKRNLGSLPAFSLRDGVQAIAVLRHPLDEGDPWLSDVTVR